jgi:hypothetical protein
MSEKKKIIRRPSKWTDKTLAAYLERCSKGGFAPNLDNQDISSLNCDGLSFNYASMVGTQMQYCRLTNCSFERAILRHVYAHGTDFSGSSFHDASIYRSNFTSCNFNGVDIMTNYGGDNDFYGSDFTNARINLESHDILGAILMRHATNREQQMIASFVAVGWRLCICWEQFLKIDTPHKEWALETLAKYATTKNTNKHLYPYMVAKEIKK